MGPSGEGLRRQHPFGPYILDFYCARARLVVEVDGGQHLETETASQDWERTRYLGRNGLRVLRFNPSPEGETMLETDAVLTVILEALARPSP